MSGKGFQYHWFPGLSVQVRIIRTIVSLDLVSQDLIVCPDSSVVRALVFGSGGHGFVSQRGH